MKGILIGEKKWRKMIKKKSSSKFMETAIYNLYRYLKPLKNVLQIYCHRVCL